MPMHAPGRDLPVFSLRQEELPELRSWSINGKYYLIVKVEMTGKNVASIYGKVDSGDKGKMEGTFEVLSVKALGDTPITVDNLEQADFEKKVAKARTSKV